MVRSTVCFKIEAKMLNFKGTELSTKALFRLICKAGMRLLSLLKKTKNQLLGLEFWSKKETNLNFILCTLTMAKWMFSKLTIKCIRWSVTTQTKSILTSHQQTFHKTNWIQLFSSQLWLSGIRMLLIHSANLSLLAISLSLAPFLIRAV